MVYLTYIISEISHVIYWRKKNLKLFEVIDGDLCLGRAGA